MIVALDLDSFPQAKFPQALLTDILEGRLRCVAGKSAGGGIGFPHKATMKERERRGVEDEEREREREEKGSAVFTLLRERSFLERSRF